MLDFQKKIVGPAGPQVFIFCRQNKYSGRQKLYLRINGFSFLKDNGLSLVYVFPKKRVTYLGGQVSDQAWKFGRHWVKAGRIGHPTGCNVKPDVHVIMGRLHYFSSTSFSLLHMNNVSGYCEKLHNKNVLEKQYSTM